MLVVPLPASRICTHFGVTRHAIIGIVRRDPVLRAIGLKGRTGFLPKKKSRYAGVLAAPKPKAQHFRVHNIVAKKEGRQFDRDIPAPIPTVFECRYIPLMDLKRGECKFPVNDAKPGEMHLFCGNPTGFDKPYCEGHAAISYQSRALDRRHAAGD